jgi:hypothetical protein
VCSLLRVPSFSAIATPEVSTFAAAVNGVYAYLISFELASGKVLRRIDRASDSDG